MSSPLLRRTIDVALVEDSLREESRTATFVASTESLDSHGTILRQDWDLSRYERNPIVLWNHNPNEPIGTASIRVEDGQLLADVTFDDVDPQAIRVQGLVKRKVVRGMSVGFRAGQTTLVDTGDGFVPVYSQNKLFEVSVVSLPSNEDSLARAAELSHLETIMAGQNTPAPEPTTARGADTLTRAEHESILRDTRNTHDASIRSMQATADQAAADAAKAEARAAAAEKALAALEQRNAELREDILERKLDSFQGRKFAPTERQEMLETIREDEGRFDRMMAKRADIVGPPILPSEKALDERTTTSERPERTQPRGVVPMSPTLRAAVDAHRARGLSHNDALTAAVRELGKPSEIR